LKTWLAEICKADPRVLLISYYLGNSSSLSKIYILVCKLIKKVVINRFLSKSKQGNNCSMLTLIKYFINCRARRRVAEHAGVFINPWFHEFSSDFSGPWFCCLDMNDFVFLKKKLELFLDFFLELKKNCKTFRQNAERGAASIYKSLISRIFFWVFRSLIFVVLLCMICSGRYSITLLLPNAMDWISGTFIWNLKKKKFRQCAERGVVLGSLVIFLDFFFGNFFFNIFPAKLGAQRSFRRVVIIHVHTISRFHVQ
jgi:hypothetical protein